MNRVLVPGRPITMAEVPTLAGTLGLPAGNAYLTKVEHNDDLVRIILPRKKLDKWHMLDAVELAVGHSPDCVRIEMLDITREVHAVYVRGRAGEWRPFVSLEL